MDNNENLISNIHDGLSNLAYDVRKAQEGIRRDTPIWKVQQFLDSIAYTAAELSKGKYHE